MALLVQKFGGTSMSGLERIQAVAKRIIKTREAGHQVVVVVSAISGETDRLIELAKSFHAEPHPREYDTLVATGEQTSMALLAITLHAQGYAARSHTGGQAGIKTDGTHNKARIIDINTQAIQAALQAGEIPIVAGFQGATENGDITTLGRGGSDTTAVALATALKADECQIYTDVEGVYTSDPRVVTQARFLSQVTFEEMLELASLGAKVLQIRAVEFAGKYRIPLRVLSSFTHGPGTLITFEEPNTMEQPFVSGIAFNRHEAKLTIMGVPEGPGAVAKILKPISDANIDVDMIIQNIAIDNRFDLTFTIHRDDYPRALDILTMLSPQMGARDVIGDHRIAKLSAVGIGMRSHAGIASKLFQVLGQEGINIQLISTSEIKISVVIDEKYLELGARALHTAFGLDKEPEEDG